MRGALIKTGILPLAAALAAGSVGHAALSPLDRLSSDVLDILPPSARVSGTPGKMTIQSSSCRSLPTENVRRRRGSTGVGVFWVQRRRPNDRVRDLSGRTTGIESPTAARLPGVGTGRRFDRGLLDGDVRRRLDSREAEPGLERSERCRSALAGSVVRSVYLMGHV